MSNKIDIFLKKIDSLKQIQKGCLIDEAISNHDLIVILGAPGSGKSSILQKYKEENYNNVELTSAKKIIKLPLPSLTLKTFLLIDAVDEYRSVSPDKDFVLTELGDKIKEVPKGIKVIITCREMDWYGDSDVSALKDEVNIEAAVYHILPLNHEQKVKLCSLQQVQNTDDFLRRYNNSGFLDNPQMFCMLSELYNKNNCKIIGTKKELYETFIKNATEKNPSYKNNNINIIEPDELLKYVGYIAYYHIFCDVENFSEEFIDEISSQIDGFPRDKIQVTVKTPLFSEERFIHRTIAEFALADFIVKYKLNEGGQISLKRIESQFSIKGNVPTGLRGTYAWLCSITMNQKLIDIDPFYQSVHGDNAFFSKEFKENIVLSVKEYSKTNPYFMSNWWGREIESFYNENLDSFLIKELDAALIMNNHYIYYLTTLIDSGVMLGSNLTKYIKNLLKNENVPAYYKNGMINALYVDRSNTSFLKELLDFIIDDKIEDNDNQLKNEILNNLYPEYISYSEIVTYLISYKPSNHLSPAYYLYRTKYEDKFYIVDYLHRFYSKPKAEYKLLDFPTHVENFIHDYFLETILKYVSKELEALDIYQILKGFKKYYGLSQKILFKSYRSYLSDAENMYSSQMADLSNELFSLYLDDLIVLPNLDLYNSPQDFSNLFSYTKPTKYTEILLSKISKDNSITMNRDLLYLVYNTNNIPVENIIEFAKRLNLEEEVNKWIKSSTEPNEWQKEREGIDNKIEEERNKSIIKNEKFFSGLSDKDIREHFGVLKFIATFIYFCEPKKKIPITEKTFKKLKVILKSIVNDVPGKFIDLLSIDKLGKDTIHADREVDFVFYTSCCLNSYKEMKFRNNGFYSYLYIVCISHLDTVNICHIDWIKEYENDYPDEVLNTLRLYNSILLERFFPTIAKLLTKYINKEKDVVKLKILAKFPTFDKMTPEDAFLSIFLNNYAFTITIDDLIQIETANNNRDINKNAIVALIAFIKNDIDNFTLEMAVAIFKVFDFYEKNQLTIKNFTTLERQKVAHFLISPFNTEELLEYKSGFQSDKDQCANFLNQNLLQQLEINELKNLLKEHSNDIWYKRILQQISIKKQQEADNKFKPVQISKLKDFILSNTITTKRDFFTDICLKLEELRKEIESNRNNDKNDFYIDTKPRIENECRDVVLRRLKDKYGNNIDLTKEKHEGENRADLNIRYKPELIFEVQIECKRDDNAAIYSGVKDQLVNKYFSTDLEVEYGIYLVFYFGKKNKDKMLKKINVPHKYKDKIEVICIDLTKP